MVKITNMIKAGYDIIEILVWETVGRPLMIFSVFIKQYPDISLPIIKICIDKIVPGIGTYNMHKTIPT